jgi:hypothetical protein
MSNKNNRQLALLKKLVNPFHSQVTCLARSVNRSLKRNTIAGDQFFRTLYNLVFPGKVYDSDYIPFCFHADKLELCVNELFQAPIDDKIELLLEKVCKTVNNPAPLEHYRKNIISTRKGDFIVNYGTMGLGAFLIIMLNGILLLLDTVFHASYFDHYGFIKNGPVSFFIIIFATVLGAVLWPILLKNYNTLKQRTSSSSKV